MYTQTEPTKLSLYTGVYQPQGLASLVWSPAPIGLSRGTNFCLFSPNSEQCIVANNKKLYIWRTSNGELLHTLEVNSPVLYGIYSCDGRSLLTIHEDDAIQIWNTDRYESRVTIPGVQAKSRGGFPTRDYASYLGCLHTFSATGNSILVAYAYGSFSQLNANTGQLEMDFSLPKAARIISCGYMRCGKIISAFWLDPENIIKIWDSLTGECVYTQNISGDFYFQPYLLPNSDKLIFPNMRGTGVIIYDFGQGLPAERVEIDHCYQEMAYSSRLYFSNDGMSILHELPRKSYKPRETERWLAIRNLHTKKNMYSTLIPDETRCLAFSPCGNMILIVSIEGRAELLKLPRKFGPVPAIAAENSRCTIGQEIHFRNVPAQINSAVFSSNNKYCAITHEQSLVIYNVEMGHIERILTCEEPIWSCEYLPTGQIASLHSSVAPLQACKIVRIWDCASGVCQQRWELPIIPQRNPASANTHIFSCSPNGRAVLINDAENLLQFNLQTGAEELRIPCQGILKFGYFATGRIFCYFVNAATEQYFIHIHDQSTGRYLYREQYGYKFPIAFCRSNNMLGVYNSLYNFSENSREPLVRQIATENFGLYRDAVFCMDGDFVVKVDRYDGICILNLRNDKRDTFRMDQRINNIEQIVLSHHSTMAIILCKNKIYLLHLLRDLQVSPFVQPLAQRRVSDATTQTSLRVEAQPIEIQTDPEPFRLTDCLICRGEYAPPVRRPMVLDCGHTICSACAIVLQPAAQAAAPVICPFCRAPTNMNRQQFF